MSFLRPTQPLLWLAGLILLLLPAILILGVRPTSSSPPRAPATSSPCPDYDGDGQVTVADVQAVATRWRLTAANFDPDGNPATPNYAPAFDLDGDGVITVLDIQAAAAQLGAACPCRPAIEFTHVPAYGSTEDLQGRVLCADPTMHAIAAFIYVDGWYNKPYWNPRLTPIQPDGAWTCDVTTGGGDPSATQLAAFLVPAGYNPPVMNDEGSLPAELWANVEAHRIVSRGVSPRILQFAGYSWLVKASETPVGPGDNYFSDRPEDVTVDAEGRLRMHIIQRDGHWYSTEVVTEAPLGFGDYVFRVAALTRLLDPNAVLGLFTWDDDASQNNFRELDVELARWGDPLNQIAQYVVQPYTHEGNIYRFDFDLLADRSTHCFAWRSGSVAFQSVWGDAACPGPAQGQIAAWTYTGADVPPAGEGHTRINLWLMSGHPPTDGQPIEVVIEGFAFTPAQN
ncbi:MAG: dockerin type I domain-containing protein [Chloroflexi bacterium]|nr:dockerin type I domain-containing protein [Chloroflexota bacterium]